MGRTHALSGIALFTAGAVPLHMAPGQVLLGAVVCAGAAVLPDIDHHGSHIARTFGPLTRGFAWSIGKVSGGHRNGTHSALGVSLIAAFTFLAVGVHTANLTTLKIGCVIAAAMLLAGLMYGLLDRTRGRGARAYKEKWHGVVAIMVCAGLATLIAVALYRYGQIVGSVLVGGILVLVLAAAIRPLAIKGVWDDLAPIPIAFVLVWKDADLSILPYAVVIGVVIHITGDMITHGGCPIGWPWSQTMRGVKWFKTGSRTEKRVVAPLLAVVLVLGVGFQLAPAAIEAYERISPPAGTLQR